jgi:pyruvate,water dikinase
MDEDLLKIRMATYEANSKLKPPRIFTGDWEILFSKPTKITKKWAITGTPASSWIVEWRARVILKLEDADLQKWDIIVTTYTDPAWTTLFWIASAVVTEVGWLLTHGAVVAREYWIPAIVWVDNATTVIVDGMMIRVNGNEGYIEILE